MDLKAPFDLSASDMLYYQVLMIFFILVLFGWYWSVAMGLRSLVPDTVKMNVGLFKIAFIIPFFYLLAFIIYFFNFSELGSDPPAFSLIFPVHVLSMFCMLYIMYFMAKTIKTAEVGTNVTFPEFAGEFLMIWVLPVGIWILQPRINRLAGKK